MAGPSFALLGEVRPQVRAKSILVVEDDPYISTLIASVLEVEGYRVSVATNGLEALNTLEGGLPDLILLDMNMPLMDGWEFAREFRSRYGSWPPIVVMSASANPMDVARNLGAAEGFGKPFDILELCELAARWTGAAAPVHAQESPRP